MSKLILILLIVPFLATGQEVTIHFDVRNSTAKVIEILRGDYTNADVLFEKESEISVPLIKGKAKWTYMFSKPSFVTTFYQDSVTDKYFSYVFYLSPGDNLNFSFDSKKPETTYIVKGKGSKNNQPSIQNIINNKLNLAANKRDSLPDNVFRAIKEKATQNQKLLSEYISGNQPTTEFINIYSLYVQYFPMWTYIQFKGNQKYNIPRQSYSRNEDKWQTIEDSLKNTVRISNNEMLSVTEYDHFLSNHLTRIKERLWQHPELLKEYYGTGTQEEAAKIFERDPENLLQEAIINKHFTGNTAEFLYAILFKGSIGEEDDNLPEIFSRFKSRYPQSKYVPYIKPSILKIEEQRKRKLNDKMVLVDNLESYQTFDDVLNFVKGKTVLLDMWGTWCGPCRSELSINSDSIKHYFKDKALDYLYIANHDIGKEIKWKELISYYNLTGTHILASLQLTKDIMTKVKGDGFPTYVIVKKDGTFELSEAGYPMKREVLIKQLEKALNN